MKKKLIIIGGGYVGFELAKKMDTIIDVTLVEPRQKFVHAPAMIRGIVDKDVRNDAIFDYKNLLNNGRVVQQKVTHILKNGVMLENGQKLDADYIVTATGSNYASPFKPDGGDIDAFIAKSDIIFEQVKGANKIVIAGGGVVGIELAGEIMSADAKKQVILICADKRLLPNYPEKMAIALDEKLSKMGVTIIYGQRVENLQSLSAPYVGNVKLSNGDEVTAELVIPVVGAKANIGLLSEMDGVEIGSLGRIKTDAWLRPTAQQNLFAAGDMVDVGDGMTIVAISRQVPWLVKCLTKLVNGADIKTIPVYTPWKKAPILVPIGPKKGNSYLPLGVVGNWLTRLIKGKNIFIPKYKKAFNIR